MKYYGHFVYFCAMLLVIVGFVLPPPGIIDGSVLIATGILLSGYQLIFGKSIKSITIGKEGLVIETFETEKGGN